MTGITVKHQEEAGRTVGFQTPYLTFILCAYLLAILFISRTRSDEPNLVAVRIENVGGLYGIC